MTENEALGYLKNSKRQKSMLGILPGSDIGNTIIKALEELKQYRTIGTPEECRAAMEKQTAKRPRIIVNAMICPSCPRCFKSDNSTYCPSCGQKLKWEDEE